MIYSVFNFLGSQEWDIFSGPPCAIISWSLLAGNRSKIGQSGNLDQRNRRLKGWFSKNTSWVQIIELVKLRRMVYAICPNLAPAGQERPKRGQK